MAARRASTSLVEWSRGLSSSNCPRAATSGRAIPRSAARKAVASPLTLQPSPISRLHIQASSYSSRTAASPSPSSSTPTHSSSEDMAFASSPLGANHSPQKILSHFSKPPFTGTNLLGDNAEIACRAMTHESFNYAKQGHNRRLAFLGRRTLKMLTTLFLHSQLQSLPKSSATHVYLTKLLSSPSGIDSILVTQRLGDSIGRELGLEKVMRWTPAVTDGQLGPRETGLFKVRGVCVEALIGAIYHEKGAQQASNFFDTFVLPKLLEDGFPTPVPDSLKSQVSSRSSIEAN